MRIIILILLIISIFALPARGQSSAGPLPAWHSAVGDELPNMPKPKADKIWLAENGILAGLYTTDWMLTSRGLGNSGPSVGPRTQYGARWHETNPILGPHPSNAKIAAYGAAVFLGGAILTRYTERSRHRWVRIGGRLAVAGTAGVEIHAIRTWQK